MPLCAKSAIELSKKPIFDESRERNANAALRKMRGRTVEKTAFDENRKNVTDALRKKRDRTFAKTAFDESRKKRNCRFARAAKNRLILFREGRGAFRA